MEKTQIAWTKQILRERGEVSRNTALAIQFTRLGAVMELLKRQGWKWHAFYRKIEGKKGRGDYVYQLDVAPLIRKIEIIDGRAVEVISKPSNGQIFL